MIHAPAEHPQALIQWLDCLADPTRLRLLRLLERHELGVVDLCDVLQMPQSTVSRHLKMLADLGWCDSRRQGTTNLYRMSLDRLDDSARRLWEITREGSDNWPTLKQDRLRLARRLRQRNLDAQAFFAGAAGDWDRLRETYYGKAFNLAAMLALIPTDWTVLDLGCGTGQLAAALAPHVRRVMGVDQSEEMLTAARQRTQALGNVELHRGELEALPFQDACCDAALMVLVLSYLANPSAGLVEMARVLRPGGKAVIVDLLRHDRDDFRRQMGQQAMGYEPAELEAMLKQAGFAGVRVEPLPPEPEARGPALVLVTAAKH
jgi:ArsR family transcriptional regulator